MRRQRDALAERLVEARDAAPIGATQEFSAGVTFHFDG